MKRRTPFHILAFEGLIHYFRGRVWKRAVRSGEKLRSALVEMWVDVDATVDGVCGKQEGACKGYNPKKKGHFPIIRRWPLWQRPRKCCTVGSDVETPTAAMAWLHLWCLGAGLVSDKCLSWLSACRFVAVRQLIRIEPGLIDLPVYDPFCYGTLRPSVQWPRTVSMKNGPPARPG